MVVEAPSSRGFTATGLIGTAQVCRTAVVILSRRVHSDGSRRREALVPPTEPVASATVGMRALTNFRTMLYAASVTVV